MIDLVDSIVTRRFHSLRRSTSWLAGYLVDCVRVDTRSLAVFRIFVGLLAVADVLLWARNFSIYYTDDGIIPQELAQADTPEYAIDVTVPATNDVMRFH